MLVQQGTYLLIRTDGTETLYKEQPTFEAIAEKLGFEEIEYLYLGNHNAIMFTYAIGGGGLNNRASQLYREAGAIVSGLDYDVTNNVLLIHENDYGAMCNQWDDTAEERRRRARIDLIWQLSELHPSTTRPN